MGELRASGERKYCPSNLAADTRLEELAATIKARWVCEQAHQQLKEELAGPRPLRGPPLARRAAPPRPAMPARLRLPAAPAARGKSLAGKAGAGPPPQPSLPAIRRHILAALTRVLLRCPHCRRRFAHHLRP